MKPVMLATDGSSTAKQATAKAIELAKLLNTDLVVVTAWDIPYGTVGLAPRPLDGGLAEMSEEEARRVVADAAAHAEENGIETLVDDRSHRARLRRGGGAGACGD
jgi:nucleotide-binding universal stress UspA family protein